MTTETKLNDAKQRAAILRAAKQAETLARTLRAQTKTGAYSKDDFRQIVLCDLSALHSLIADIEGSSP